MHSAKPVAYYGSKRSKTKFWKSIWSSFMPLERDFALSILLRAVKSLNEFIANSNSWRSLIKNVFLLDWNWSMLFMYPF